MTAPAIRTVADLADVMGLTELDDLQLLSRLAKGGYTGPAALCARFHVCKRAAALAPTWPQPDDPLTWPPRTDA
ncbi:hypothetical protein CH276_22645 [Rhodococcus sp. 06-470-2]|uniref:hypothetical protein n=1 Tax=unclassified Rhodococcus (in: high G+C Gram-positive bacteria) TaxID=192944 RepID=UPI000B9B93CC|nr:MULTISPECIES: hypothetical protein [unclassified Rhodococcus (in: high G+C Gram-positive bacteria)]OZC59249.1 hypothetical protein CH276_22645 [Rhodococcus sp. 06-470-2]OZE66836.1 hypothetical protein CH265_07970 [Rhodococcus sp. 05-2221-1B]